MKILFQVLGNRLENISEYRDDILTTTFVFQNFAYLFNGDTLVAGGITEALGGTACPP